jgi:hypothetical protein
MGVTLPARNFDPQDRLVLLRSPQIGPMVIRRLEEVGVCSIGELVLRGVEPTIQEICLRDRQPAWTNRRSALVRALCDALGAAARPCRPEARLIGDTRGADLTRL